MARPPASEQVQVNFRMPADLKVRIEEAAQANNRSTTAEIVATLEEKYPAPDVDVNMVVLSLMDRWEGLLDHMEAIIKGLQGANTQSEVDRLQADYNEIDSQLSEVKAELNKYLGDGSAS